jgi:periplasmic protein CpxP/Spy
MNRISGALGVALALGVSISAVVLADQAQPGSDGPRGPGHGHFGQALNLTDAQKSQMKALHEGSRDQTRASMKDLMQAHKDLRTLVFSDNPDAGQIEALKAKITGLQSATLAARVAMDEKIAAILTPEQRKTMASMPPFGGRHHHRHHGGGGPDGHGGPPPDGGSAN